MNCFDNIKNFNKIDEKLFFDIDYYYLIVYGCNLIVMILKIFFMILF